MGETITIKVHEGAIRASSSNGAEVNAKLNWSELNKTTIAVFDRWLKMRKLDTRDDFAAVGELLYRMLLDNEAGTMIDTSVDQAGGEPVRLELDFGQAADFAALPWEFMYQPRPRDFFYSTDRRLLLTRYIPLPYAIGDLKIGNGSLRVLVIVSKPRELGPIVSQPVIDAIYGLATSHEMEIAVDDDPPVELIHARIGEMKPHVVHYIGHGRFDSVTRRTQLAFVADDATSVHWVDEDTVAFLFDDHAPRLVVLQACEGGVIETATKFSGIAPLLTERRIPAIVAMQYPVFNRAATTFSTTFYELLDGGEPVEVAVQGGRRAVAMSSPSVHSQRDFGAPVLYLRGRDGRILPPARKGEHV